MLKAAKALVLQAAKASGAFGLTLRSAWRGRRLLILCYHGISLEDEHEWSPGLYLSAEMFRRRLELLREGRYRVLPLTEGLRLLYAGELPDRSVAITFDDGAHDFREHAYPLLREFDYPATVYLTTFYCRHQAPVFDTVCSYILWKGRGRTLEASRLMGGGEGQWSLRTPAETKEVFWRLYHYVRDAHLSAEQKDELARDLAYRLGVDYEHIRAKRMLYLMTPEEVREVAAGGSISIQLHTHRHRTPRDRDLFLREIRDNQREIREMTGVPEQPVHFCYPSGDQAPEMLPWLKEAGVESGATNRVGFCTRDSHPLLLPRFLDTATLSPIEFEGWLTGFSACLPRRSAIMNTLVPPTSSPPHVRYRRVHFDNGKTATGPGAGDVRPDSSSRPGR